MYWSFLQTKQQEWWQEIVSQYKKKHNSIIHLVSFLYKLYISKTKLVKTVKSVEHVKHVEPTKSVEPVKPVESVKPVEPVKPVVKRPKCYCANKHTPLSNYKEWKKNQMGFKSSDSVPTNIMNKWQKEDNFDKNPKKYTANLPWYNYITLNMD